MSKPFYRHSKSGVTKIQRTGYGQDWWALQLAVRKRDNFCCRKCNAPERPKEGVYHHVHHLIKLSRGGTNSMSNLVTLCEGCHSKMPGHKHMHKDEKPKLLESKAPPLPSFLTNRRNNR